jgi:hypothetical protein
MPMDMFYRCIRQLTARPLQLACRFSETLKAQNWKLETDYMPSARIIGS